MAEFLRQRVLIDHGSLTVNELMGETNLSADEALKYHVGSEAKETQGKVTAFYSVHGISKDGFKKIALFSASKLSETNDHFGSVAGQCLHLIRSTDFKPQIVCSEDHLSQASQIVNPPEAKPDHVEMKEELPPPASEKTEEKPVLKMPEPAAIKKTKQTSMSMFFKK